VAEALALTAAPKTTVAETRMSVGRFLGFVGTPANSSYGLPLPSSFASNYVDYLNVEGVGDAFPGAIIVHLRGDAKLEGKTLPLIPVLAEGGIKWSCTATGYDTLEVKYRPTSCRP
jgi:hypothetical protein